jgi:glycosyltransferase involved in cell wall biosynthesis
VDFWDIDDMANKIIGLLTYEVMHNHMRNKAYEEFDQFTWEKPAAELQSIYRELVNNEQ